MTPRRAIAAATAVLTALILQATVLTPLTAPIVLSLPAMLVAVIGLEAGASAGMSIGFSAGLLADLASEHPAGVLALAWLVLGLLGGLLAQPRRRGWWSAVLATVGATSIGLLVSVSFALLDGPRGAAASVLAEAAPTTAAYAALALLVVPSVRVVLRALRVQAPRPQPVAAASVSGRVAPTVAARVSSG